MEGFVRVGAKFVAKLAMTSYGRKVHFRPFPGCIRPYKAPKDIIHGPKCSEMHLIAIYGNCMFCDIGVYRICTCHSVPQLCHRPPLSP